MSKRKADSTLDSPDKKTKFDFNKIKQELRSQGEPIRLFGETDEDVIERLKSLKPKEKLETTYANRLMEAKKGNTKQSVLPQELERNHILSIDTTGISIDLYNHDKKFCSYLIIIYIKKLLIQWDHQLQKNAGETPNEIVQKVNHSQTQADLRPLLKLLKKGVLEDDVAKKLCQMCYWMQLREYMKANDAYLTLSIGNAAWPIGVAGVTIHERKGRDKLLPNQIAHALNDETKRKWIQGFKRLITFAQSKWPPETRSKMMG